MTPKLLPPQTRSIKGLQAVSFFLILSLILAFVGFQVYYLILTLFAK